MIAWNRFLVLAGLQSDLEREKTKLFDVTFLRKRTSGLQQGGGALLGDILSLSLRGAAAAACTGVKCPAGGRIHHSGALQE